MKKFQEHITEVTKDLNSMDLSFIKRAEVITAFNITGNDFQSEKYKAEIQYLFKKHFFPEFDLTKTAKTLDEAKVNSLVRELRQKYKQSFLRLLKYTPKGVGPGEVMMYFLVDDLTLGGGASAGLDLGSGGKGYEMKACNLTQDGFFQDFKIGGTVDITKPLAAAVAIKREMLEEKVKGLRGKPTEIAKGDMAVIKSSNWSTRWEAEVEKPYKATVYNDYFKTHPVVFAINSTPKAMQGQIFVREIRKDSIEIHQVTSGTIKPKIRY